MRCYAALIALTVGALGCSHDRGGGGDGGARDLAVPDGSAAIDLALPDGALASDGGSGGALWVTAYFTGSSQGSTLDVSDIDFSALTHVIHFSLRPQSDGSLSDAEIAPAKAAELVAAAHAAGKKALVCVGGSNDGSTGPAFAAAIGAAARATLVANLAALVQARGYDGVDIDFEPLDPAALADPSLLDDYAAFVTALRAALPSPLLVTAAPESGRTTSQPALFATLAPLLDQVNVQTYNLAGVSTGETWHNSALSNGGKIGTKTKLPLPACDVTLATYLQAGVPARKLGLGIDFHGKTWMGATMPEQALTGVSAPAPVSYAQVMDTLYTASAYHRDQTLDAAWLALPTQFVSYEDESTCPAKVTWARAHDLGGVFIWELSGGWRAAQPSGQRDLVLQAIARAAR